MIHPWRCAPVIISLMARLAFCHRSFLSNIQYMLLPPQCRNNLDSPDKPNVPPHLDSHPQIHLILPQHKASPRLHLILHTTTPPLPPMALRGQSHIDPLAISNGDTYHHDRPQPTPFFPLRRHLSQFVHLPTSRPLRQTATTAKKPPTPSP